MTGRGRDVTESQLTSGLLEGLTPREQKVVLAAGRRHRFVGHSIVTHQETPADRLFLLTSGRARYFFVTPDGRKIPLFALVPGDSFGGAALLSRPSNYHVSTETVKDSCVWTWDRNTIRALAVKYPKLLENELSTGSDYLVWYVATHLALTCRSAQGRLAYVLFNLVRGIRQEDRHGRELDMTNQELAQAANLTEFTVSRLLSEWQRQGAIVKRRGKVLVRSYERLLRHSA